MADESNAGFFFNVQKWRGSVAVKRMSFAEQGVYLNMMLEQWEKRSLPDDAQAVADLIAVTPTQHAEVIAAWPTVRQKFVRAEKGPVRIYNVPLERVRRAQKLFRRAKSEAGKKGGETRALHLRQQKELLAGTATALPSSAERSVSDKKGKDKKGIEKQSKEEKGRGSRPRFSGQRVTVFDWMFEECRRTLGAYADDFDLDGWFRDLDDMAVRSGLVIPAKGGYDWLQAQLVSEAQKRHLPLKFARPEQAEVVSIRTQGTVDAMKRAAARIMERAE